MPTTLEMPSDVDQRSDPSVSDAEEQSHAEQAADMLDAPEDDNDIAGEMQPDDLSIDDVADAVAEAAPLPTEVVGQVDGESAETDDKPKRKRRSKKPAASDGDGAAAATDPPAVTEQIAKVETSRATRKMQIAEVTADYVEVCLEIENNEATIESCKAELKRLHEKASKLAGELRHLRHDEQWQPPLPLEKATPPAGAAVDAKAAEERPIPDAPAASANGDKNWRWYSISVLNLPKKLTETLVEAGAATIGGLEDLRGEISQGKAKWPKGIGAAKITAIENAVIDWLTKNRDSEAFAKAGEMLGLTPAAKPQADEPPAVVESAADKPAKAKRGRKKKSASGGDGESAPTDAEAAAQINARAAAINDGKPNCLDQKHSVDKYWESGYEAYGRGLAITDCGWVPGPEQDDWLRGWMGAKAVQDRPDAQTTKAGKSAKQLHDLDDL